ncbi:VENN motif pre-toxin domain-containing protein, partial [Cronobacter malonaticus]
DVTQANDAISPIFNKEKEQNRLQAVQMVSDIGNQVADIVRTQSDLDGLKAAIAKTGTSLQGLPEKERLAKLAALRDTDVYKKVTENTGTGSDVQRAITAATAAVSGLAGGNLNAALAGAAAPYIANEIGKNITDQNTTAGIMAHAVVNAVLAKVQGQNALIGASGAVVGEAMGILIAKEVYKKDPSQLNDTEKQTVAALSTLASGLAGALAGNSTEATATAAKAGQTTVENNFLHAEKITDFIEEQAKAKTPEEKRKLQQNIDELDKKLQAQAEGWGISTKDLKSALAGLKALEDSPQCHAQCQGMVRDSISKLEPALENRIAKHSSQPENFKELSHVLATVIVMHENGLIVGRTTSSGNEKVVPGGIGSSKSNNLAKGDIQKGGATSPVVNLPITTVSPEVEAKILSGQRVGSSNKLIGGHSPLINNGNKNYAVESINLNPDGTRVVKFITQFPDGNLSKIKTSTIFPDSWSDKNIINSVNKIGNSPAIGQREATGETLHRGVINGVEIDVIKKGNQVTAGYPVGGKPTPGFNPVN